VDALFLADLIVAALLPAKLLVAALFVVVLLPDDSLLPAVLKLTGL
jgi:hypothetical protein